MDGYPSKKNCYAGNWGIETPDAAARGWDSKNGGSFEIRVCCNYWAGSNIRGFTKTPLHYDLHIDENGVFGIGWEKKNGHYVVRGDYDRDQNEAKFVKFYVDGGADNIIYKGVADDVGDCHMLSGIWRSVRDSENTGKYKIFGVLEPGPILKKRIWWDWGKNIGMNAIWDGWYTSDNDHEKYAQQIRNFQISFTDYVVTGSGEDHNGKYKIDGNFTLDVVVVGKSTPVSEKSIKGYSRYEIERPELAEQANVVFNLTYANKTVCTYKGELQEDNMIHGTWQMGKDTGEFLLSQAGQPMKMHVERQGQFTEMDEKLSITIDGIFGVGKDEIGIWIIRGDLNLQNRTVVMAKNYLKKQSFIMNGRWNIHKGEIVLRGVWDLRELTNLKIVVPNSGGTWELRGKFGQCKAMSAKKTPLLYEEWKDKMLDLEEFVDFSEGFQMPDNVQSAGLKGPPKRGAAMGRSNTKGGTGHKPAPTGTGRPHRSHTKY